MVKYKLVFNELQQQRMRSEKIREAIRADFQMFYDPHTEINYDGDGWYAILCINDDETEEVLQNTEIVYHSHSNAELMAPPRGSHHYPWNKYLNIHQPQ